MRKRMTNDMGPLTELSLFSGAGGGLLGTTHLLGWQTVCYVEWDKYAVEVLKARIKDGYLHDAPIWDNVFTFDGRPWAGLVDVVTAGFPCQPFSVAGKGLAEDDPRNGWPATIRIIREDDRESSSWRTSQVSFLNHTLEPYSENFPKRGIVLNGIAYRRRRSARTTSGRDSGLWPTPRAKESGEYQYSQGDHSKPTLTLLGKVRMFPTPTTPRPRDSENTAGKYMPGQKQKDLTWAVHFFPTPAARDYRSPNKNGKHKDQLPNVIGGQLNPNWVEWLMGWPIGWTDLEPLATDRFQQWLEKHGGGWDE